MSETLQELFRRRQQELGGLTVRQVWLRCNGLASYETFRRVESGVHTRIGDDTVDALARALDVPPSTVINAAGQRPRLGKFVPPPRWDRLTTSERAALHAVADAILDARSGDAETTSTELHVVGHEAPPKAGGPAPGRTRVSRAAKKRDPQ